MLHPMMRRLAQNNSNGFRLLPCPTAAIAWSIWPNLPEGLKVVRLKEYEESPIDNKHLEEGEINVWCIHVQKLT